jgi:hypothetical protein
MSDETQDLIVSTKSCIGLDIGTMNLVVAKSVNGTVQTNHYRNVYLKVDKDSIGSMDISNISHAIIDDQMYFLSDNAYIHANVFGLEVCRPMNKGMVSKDLDSIDILMVMVKGLIGESTNSKNVCCYSIPANPIDSNLDCIYHESVFKRIIKELNYTPISLNEATAIIYSECIDTNFTGIGISFGAGMTNVAVVFKSIPVLTFSLARGGDWIDQNAASSIGEISNRATLIKEKSDFSLSNYNIGKKRERRLREAIIHYYISLIKYTITNIVSELNKLKIDFPNSIPIVVSGGTSKPTGFIDLIKSSFTSFDFSFDISDVRTAKNPLTSVAEGCLIRSLKG